MADQDLAELEPVSSGRGKQIVFLFMSAVVVAVVIFLLGVSVGRGVRQQTMAAAAADADADPAPPATESAAPAETPAPATSDLKYHDSLRGATPADATKTSAVTSAPPASSPGVAPPPPVNEAPSAKAPAPPAREPARPSPPPVTAPSSSAAGKYAVQVGLFSTMTAAQAMMSSVRAKDKSYPVSTVTLPQNVVGPKFRVVVGPYKTREEANRAVGRLTKDGFRAFVR